MKLFFLGSFLLVTSIAIGQVENFTDPRDGNVYETIVIGNKKWFREHVRFQTTTSFCPNFNKPGFDCSNGNYYLNSDLDSICPAGWRVATTDDWQEYIDLLVRSKMLSVDSAQTKKYSAVEHSTIVKLHEDVLKDTLLRLAPIGWVEWNKAGNQGSLSLWMVNNHTNDIKHHIHLGEDGYVLHSHDHHIIDKPKKIRKFAARCVCDIEK